ncbi:MAG TPA: glycerol-3-phosphate acyltransferase [Longilinea sp.]|nr:glycerol-3-phosphate acyltransferase [Longilinea sp.]
MITVIVVIIAYLLGSFPTALLVVKKLYGVDIRQVGDGNMGTRNTYRNFGFWPSMAVVTGDFGKGVLAVFIARWAGLTFGWQAMAGIAAIAGHDFPIFAGFKGGQGLATSLATMLSLFPEPTIVGLCVYGLAYIVTHNSDLAASLGCGTIALLLVVFNQPAIMLGYTVATLLFIPLKKFIDRRRVPQAEVISHKHAHLP